MVSSRRLVVGGVDVHSWLAGEGKAIVLVHGFGVSGRYMLPLARSLAGDFSVFVPELPGYGRSEKPHPPLGISGLATALAGCLDVLELERPAFVANSMGCQVVTELAVRVPDRVGPLVLIGPTVDPEQRVARRQLFAGLRDSGREPLGLLAIAAHDGAVMGFRAALTTARSALADRIEDRLPLVEQPTLVLRGEKDGFVTAPWAERIAELLPRARLVSIPREPHAVHYTRPDLVATLVRELLLEESEETNGELVGSFPHRHVSTSEENDLRRRQRLLPFLRDRHRHQPVALAPDEKRRSSNGGQLGAQVPVRDERDPA